MIAAHRCCWQSSPAGRVRKAGTTGWPAVLVTRFKSIEDRAVDEAVSLQEVSGARHVTDGEMQRLSFQSQMTEAVDGFGAWDINAFLWGHWHADARSGSGAAIARSISQLHRGIGGSCAFLNYAVWESVGHFRRAFIHPEFRGVSAWIHRAVRSSFSRRLKVSISAPS